MAPPEDRELRRISPRRRRRAPHQRRRAQDPDLPIIAISGGRAGFDVLAQAAKLGANATIEKPFSAAYLVDTIDRCLEARVSGS